MHILSNNNPVDYFSLCVRMIFGKCKLEKEHITIIYIASIEKDIKMAPNKKYIKMPAVHFDRVQRTSVSYWTICQWKY